MENAATPAARYKISFRGRELEVSPLNTEQDAVKSLDLFEAEIRFGFYYGKDEFTSLLKTSYDNKEDVTIIQSFKKKELEEKYLSLTEFENPNIQFLPQKVEYLNAKLLWVG